MALFYFSRSVSPSPLQERWLTSGVVEADTMEMARASLGVALRNAKNPDDESSFDFAELAQTGRSENGIVVITMGDRS